MRTATCWQGQAADITAWNPSVAGSAGAVVSTTADLDRFLTALFGGKLLPPTELARCRPPIRSPAPTASACRIQLPCGVTVYGHEGGGARVQHVRAQHPGWLTPGRGRGHLPRTARRRARRGPARRLLPLSPGPGHRGGAGAPARARDTGLRPRARPAGAARRARDPAEHEHPFKRDDHGRCLACRVRGRPAAWSLAAMFSARGGRCAGSRWCWRHRGRGSRSAQASSKPVGLKLADGGKKRTAATTSGAWSKTASISLL